MCVRVALRFVACCVLSSKSAAAVHCLKQRSLHMHVVTFVSVVIDANHTSLLLWVVIESSSLSTHTIDKPLRTRKPLTPPQYLLQDMLHTTLLASCMGLTEPARKLGLKRPPSKVVCAAVILPVLAQVRVPACASSGA